MSVRYGEMFVDGLNTCWFTRYVTHDPAVYGKPEGTEPWTTEDTCPAQFITVYSVTRHYGGPEEGGWWYNWEAPVCSLPLLDAKVDEIDLLRSILEARFRSEGDIYSVNGGVLYDIRVEPEQGYYATKERPHYE